MSGTHKLNYTRAWVANVQDQMSKRIESLSQSCRKEMSSLPEQDCNSDYEYDYTKVDRSQIDKEYERDAVDREAALAGGGKKLQF